MSHIKFINQEYLTVYNIDTLKATIVRQYKAFTLHNLRRQNFDIKTRNFFEKSVDIKKSK